MIDPLELTAQAMLRDMRQFNTISQNVANVNTQGYKALHPAVEQPLSIEQSSLIQNKSAVSLARNTAISDGALNKTDQALDFALTGNGFFVIKQDAQQLLTRSGHFITDQQGFIRTATGGFLMGKAGPIQIELGNLELTRNGELFLNGDLLDKLKIVVPLSGEQLKHQGAGHYQVSNVQQADDRQFQLHQGYLEASNVDVAGEMIQLLSTQRHFGLMQRYMATYDGMVKEAINSLGK